jgi:hypothetical protein
MTPPWPIFGNSAMADISGRVLTFLHGQFYAGRRRHMSTGMAGFWPSPLTKLDIRNIQIFGDYYIIQVDFASKLCLTRREMKSGVCIELKN